ncbi:MAG: hypothetical protein M9958_05845 [Chitinophagales bacterium]|nr:hypothetical protein [Chitinophagales bacterium]
MRTLNFIILLSSLLIFNACKKDESSNKAAELQAGHSMVTLTASGATSGDFKSNDLTSLVSKSGFEINLSASSVNTSTLSTEMVMMLLPADITAGTYNLKTMPSSAVLPTFSYMKGSTGWAAAPTDNFTIVVSKATSTEIEGTFSGTLHNDSDGTDVTISKGTFAAKY